jgi:hypothetical protein
MSKKWHIISLACMSPEKINTSELLLSLIEITPCPFIFPLKMLKAPRLIVLAPCHWRDQLPSAG